MHWETLWNNEDSTKYPYLNMAAPWNVHRQCKQCTKTSQMTNSNHILPEFLAYYDTSEYNFHGNDYR